MVLPDTTRLVAQPLATFERVLVASPAYLRRHSAPRSASDLARHAIVLGTSSSSTWLFTEGGERREVTVVPKIRVGTLFGQLAAARWNLGLALLPRFVVAEDLAAGRLRALLPALTFSTVSAHALYRQELRGTPRVQAVVAHLRETLPFVAPTSHRPLRSRRRS